MATPQEEPTPIYDALVKEYTSRMIFDRFFNKEEEENA